MHQSWPPWLQPRCQGGADRQPFQLRERLFYINNAAGFRALQFQAIEDGAVAGVDGNRNAVGNRRAGNVNPIGPQPRIQRIRLHLQRPAGVIGGPGEHQIAGGNGHRDVGADGINRHHRRHRNRAIDRQVVGPIHIGSRQHRQRD